MVKRWVCWVVGALLLGGVLLGAVVAPAQAAQVAFGTVVNTSALNVRQFPTVSAPVVATLVGGEVVGLQGRTADAAWYLVQRGSGILGWSSSAFILTANPFALPVVDAGVVVPTPPSAFVPTATVAVAFLNVRTAPDPFTAPVIGQVRQGEVYRLVGRNLDSTWFQLDLSGGVSGWANGFYLTVVGSQQVPVTSNTTLPTRPPVVHPPTPVPPPPVSGATANVTAFVLNVRTAPDPVIGQIITRVTRGQTLAVTGRDQARTWVRVALPNGQPGWVSGAFVTLNVPFSQLPIADASFTQATVNTAFLNLRDAPNATFGRILAQISYGQAYPVVGRNANSSWVQLRLPTGLTGWVNASLVILGGPGLGAVPVTG